MKAYTLSVLFCWVLIFSAPMSVGALPPDDQHIVDTKGSRKTQSLSELDEVIRENTLRELSELKRQGYLSIPDEQANLYLLKNHSPYFNDDKKVQRQSPFKISHFAAGSRVTRLGITGIDLTGNSKFDRIIQAYSLSRTKDITVLLDEINFAKAGMNITEIKEMYNTEINGHPGIATYRRARNGISVFLLTWSTESRLYNLSLAGTEKQLRSVDREQVLNLAKTVHY